MNIEGAIVKEQGVTFAIVIVRPFAMQTSFESEKTRESFQSQILDFQNIPLILASRDSRGVFSYQGRPDIVNLLASIDPARIPWRTYTVA